MSKFYAVRQGRQPGIYTEWTEAKAQIHQYKEAIYKSFQTRAEAEAFMQQGGKEEIPEGLPIAFIDGSFSKSAGLYSYGGFIEAAGSYFILQGTGSNPEYMPDRNIAGELLGALNVSFQAQRMGLKEIVLYFDYVRDDTRQRDSARSVLGKEMDSRLGIGINEGLCEGSRGNDWGPGT